MTFIHLRCHSDFSLSQGAIRVDDLIELAKQSHMPAIAITETNNLFSSLEFSLAALKNGIQPIIGCSIAINLEDKDNIIGNIVILAKNEIGYQNLLILGSKSFFNQRETGSNTIKLTDLFKHAEGLICLSGGNLGPFAALILQQQFVKLDEYFLKFKQVFQDDFYVEIMRHGLEVQEQIENNLIEIAYKHQVALVATNDVMFKTSEMYEAFKVLNFIAQGKFLEQDLLPDYTQEHYFKSQSEMIELFKDLPEAIENTKIIAQKCYVFSEYRDPILPKLGENESLELKKQANDGLKQRLKNFSGDENIYFTRLEYELDVINNMGFPGYFLIVADFINWSKQNDIPVGPGRGSGAGSVVAWALNITDLDPIKFGLLFERFLNPERVSLPDFDIDFCQEKRDQVIEYVKEKYGPDRVAQIITFGKLQARAVIRDVGRVLQLPYGQVDRISKLVPFNAVNPVSLKQAIDMEPVFNIEANKDPAVAKLLKIALELEGLNRHASTHAAGIVIAHRPLQEFIPLYCDDKSDMLVVQYSMKYAELSGLVKFDFLGLKTLTLIDHVVKLIKQNQPDFVIDDIRLDDPHLFNMMAKGLSSGVFQFESSGMKDSLRKMKADSFEDLIALGALYRPGPMDNIPSYIACKNGVQKPDYLHPSLENILTETFGVIIYQEQVMQIAQEMGGYSLGAADLLRRAMGKKIKSEMDAQREIFVQGAINKGIQEKQASLIFDKVAKFAGYGFNKAHATAYAMISYQTAFLKANFPLEFFTAALNLEFDDTDKLNIFVQDAGNFDVKILPPDINLSKAYFAIEQNHIRYGLAAIKNVGLNAVVEMELRRSSKGAFSSIFDFIEKLDDKIINKRMFESLVKSGAFKNIHSNSKEIFQSIELLTNYLNLFHKAQDNSQIGLFAKGANVITAPSLYKVEDWSANEKIKYEYEALGFYLTEHPLNQYQFILKKMGLPSNAYLLDTLSHGYHVLNIVGVLLNSKAKTSPKGRYLQCLLSDSSGVIEISFYDNFIVSQMPKYLENNQPLYLNIEVRKDSGGIRALGLEVTFFEEFLANNLTSFSLTLLNRQQVSEFCNIMQNYIPGKVKANLRVKTDEEHYAIVDLKKEFTLDSTALIDLVKINQQSFELIFKR